MSIEKFVEVYQFEFNYMFFGRGEKSIADKVGNFLFKPRFKVKGFNFSLV